MFFEPHTKETSVCLSSQLELMLSLSSFELSNYVFHEGLRQLEKLLMNDRQCKNVKTARSRLFLLPWCVFFFVVLLVLRPTCLFVCVPCFVFCFCSLSCFM